MPIESATKISELNASNPIGASDTPSSLDDHIRLVKTVLKADAASISAGVTTYIGTVGGTANAFTLTPSTAITAYVAGLSFAFLAVGTSSAAVTVNVSGFGAKAVQLSNAALVSGELVGGKMCSIRYDGTNFQLTALIAGAAIQDFSAKKLTLGAGSLIESEGAAVASAATTNIWAGDGNTVHITGTTTITSLGTAPQAGAWMKVIFDGILTLTHGANLNLRGSANITTAADDLAFVYADTTTQLDVIYFPKVGTATLATNTFTGAQIGTVTALTSTAASMAINLATNNNFSHATTENTTLAAPSSPVAGQSGIITITQGATARTLAYNTFWKFPGGTIPTLTATVGAVDVFAYYVESATRATCQLIKDSK